MHSDEMAGLYELSVIKIDTRPKRSYKYTVSEGKRALFMSYEDADNYIRTHIKELQDDCDIYCIYLREKPLGQAIYSDEYLSVWLYDENGIQIDKRLVDNINCVTEMPCRMYNEKRFKPGDIVEWKSGNEVSLCYIAGRDLTTAEIQHYDECSSLISCTVDGDKVTVLDSYSYSGHYHVDWLNLFKPHFDIPQSTLSRFKRMRKRYLKELEDYCNASNCYSYV